MEIERRIREALDQERFVLHAQPIVGLQSGEVERHELLLRMRDADGDGLTSPAEFLPEAEDLGLIREIDRWVISQAAGMLGGGIDCLEVNLSGKSMANPELPAMIEQDLADAGADPSRLILEITETAAMEKPTNAIATLRELKALGVRLALDDFGTGHSSLEYLQRLPFDMLKIDRTFFADTVQNRAIVGAVTDLAHGLGLVVTAEGLETIDQVAWACEAGCDRGQGYYFARPLAADELRTLCAADHAYEMPALAALPA